MSILFPPLIDDKLHDDRSFVCSVYYCILINQCIVWHEIVPVKIHVKESTESYDYRGMGLKLSMMEKLTCAQ